jgi:hypothetical protein
MKTFVLRDNPPFPSREIIKAVVEGNDGQNGIALDEMRRRMRILDALEKANGALALEDSDWELLCGLLRRFPFARADRQIIQIADDIEQASSGP